MGAGEGRMAGQIQTKTTSKFKQIRANSSKFGHGRHHANTLKLEEEPHEGANSAQPTQVVIILIGAEWMFSVTPEGGPVEHVRLFF